jgi:hypothetical protein
MTHIPTLSPLVEPSALATTRQAELDSRISTVLDRIRTGWDRLGRLDRNPRTVVPRIAQ